MENGATTQDGSMTLLLLGGSASYLDDITLIIQSGILIHFDDHTFQNGRELPLRAFVESLRPTLCGRYEKTTPGLPTRTHIKQPPFDSQSPGRNPLSGFEVEAAIRRGLLPRLSGH